MARSAIPLDNPARASEATRMAAAELHLAPRTTGRAVARLEVVAVRPLTPADLALLASEREVPAPSVAVKLRDRHHALARCLAQGMSQAEASMITGYNQPWISTLLRDPTFQALVADYASIEAGLQAEFMERASVLSLTAMNNLQDALEDDAKPVPLSMTLEIAKFAADRTGHAPVQKSLNINANVDLGSRMEAARRRLAEVVEGKRLGSATG